MQVKGNAAVVAQVTVHTDHMFWEALAHDATADVTPMFEQAILHYRAVLKSDPNNEQAKADLAELTTEKAQSKDK